MPKSFIEVEDEYKAFKGQHPDDPTPLGEFAKQMDEIQGTQDRTEAYHDGFFKKANALVDRGFRATGLPDLTGAAVGAVGSGFDSLAGTHIAPTVERIGQDLPRMITESLLTIPEAASGVGLPVAGATWLNRINQLKKIVGYGGSALGGYAATDSPLGAAIGAGSMYGANKLLLPAERGGLDVAGRTANMLRDKLGMEAAPITNATARDLAVNEAPDLTVDAANRAKNILAILGGTATEGATAMGLNEVTRQANLSVGPNAVGLHDPARNPFTPENLAGNVVNLGMLAPQVVHGLGKGSMLDPRQSKPMLDWIATRRKAVEETTRSEGMVTPEQVHDELGTTKNAPVHVKPGQEEFDLTDALAAQPRFGEADEKRLADTIRGHLDAARELDRQGVHDQAEFYRSRAKEALDSVGKPMADLPGSFKEAVVDLRDRPFMVRSGVDVAQLGGEVNRLIEFYNENRVKVEEGELPPSKIGTPEQSYHPNARDPSVIERLQDKGLLPVITKEWVKTEYNATYDDLGNPQFATDVVAQKIVNRFLDALPEALKNEPVGQVEPVKSPQVAKVDTNETAFLNALDKFSSNPTIFEKLIKRTAEIRRSPDKFVQGRQLNRNDSWQRAIITAAESYDPVSQTADIYRSGKLVRGTIATLWDKSYEPVLTPVKPGAGGKGKVTVGGKTIPETNIEGLAVPENVVPEGEQSVVEQASQAGLAGDTSQGALFRGRGEEGVTPDEGPPIAAETQKAFDDRFYKQSEQLRKAVAPLTDAHVWNLVKGFVSGSRRDSVTGFWSKNAKTVLDALIENSTTSRGDKLGPASDKLLSLWTESGMKPAGATPRERFQRVLLNLFRADSPLEGVSKTGQNARGDKVVTNRNETALGRQKLLLEQILNPRAVEAAKTWQGPMKMVEESPEKVKSAAVRLSDGTVITGPNHPLIVDGRAGQAIPPDKWSTIEMGFVTDKDRFVDREEAFSLAKSAEQLVGPAKTDAGQTALENSDYSRPMAGETGEGSMTGAGKDDLLVNHPKPGDFARDVERTLDAHLGSLGYSGDFRSLALAAARAVMKESGKLPVDFYRISGRELGLANYDLVPERGQLGLLVDGSSKDVVAVHKLLSVLNHELAHIDDFVQYGMLNAPDAYSQERKRQLDNLQRMFDSTSPAERRAILLTYDEGIRPPAFRTTLRDAGPQLEAATQNFAEFSATMRQITSDSLLWGKSGKLRSALETLDYLPTEIQEHSQFQYRTIRDVLGGLIKTIEDPSIRANAKKPGYVPEGTDPYVLGHLFSATVAAAEAGARVRDSMWDVKSGKSMVEAMVPGSATQPPPEMTSAMWFRKRNEIGRYHPTLENHSPYAMANAEDGIRQARGTLGLSWEDKKPGMWASFLYPFGNLMHSMERSGVDIARPIANLIFDTESAIHRRYSDIVGPFIKQAADGTISWNDEHPLLKGLARDKNGPVREGFNRVSQWQSEHDSQPMFTEASGQVVVNDAAKASWDKIKSGLSAEDQQIVMSGSVAADKVGQNEARHTLSVLDEMMTTRTASLLMMANRKMTYDQAYAIADKVTEAYQSKNVLSLQGTGLAPGILGTVDKLLGGPTGLAAQFEQVGQMLAKRTGYRTEQLPHDWIVMYDTKEGETKFASAPDEKRAQYVLNQKVLQGGTAVGEILNRNDLRSKYQAFDDPDVLLQKFAQVEGKAWDNVVEDARVKFGDEVANDLKASFTPGATSLKDVGTQGFNKFLKPAQSQIERGSFDYLDAMFARANRLAASASYKTHGAMKDLILNDPRARLFPTLRELVDTHWQNMLSPTSEATKQMKALTTGMYLGANLSSAAVEGTQSISTVVPLLIAGNNSGGPVKAYGQLFKSIGDSVEVSLSKDWQSRAAQAEAKLRVNPDEKLTPNETKAMMYRRFVTNGEVGHGVIEDLLFSNDQKALQMAKFGQGDYGPVPLSTMITSPLYMGAKLMMKMYTPMSKFNDKIAIFAGLNQGIEKGLTGDDLYNHVRQFKYLSTFGGGKANEIGAVSTLGKAGPEVRSAVGMLKTLQQYGFGMVAMYSQFAKDSIDSNKSLTPVQRRQAQKAFGTMLATQVAVGGALGVPFAGAALTLLEKTFGVPANQLVRQGLASLGTDDDSGAVIAETAMNGAPNQFLGLDVSSRMGVSNLLGTSTYRGFDLRDMAGPVPSLIGNMAQGLGYFAQGNPWQATHSLVPNAFKNAVLMAESHSKYGDYAIRDSSENLQYTPSEGESLGRILGFRPRIQSLRGQAQGLLSGVDKRSADATSRVQDGLAQQLLAGDPQAARGYARDIHYADPTVRESDLLRSVMERAVRASREKDLLAGGTRQSADERTAVMGTFPAGTNPRQSEVGLEQLRMQLAAQLGSPELMPQGKDWSRAAVVDKLTGSGMARSQAVALTRFLGL